VEDDAVVVAAEVALALLGELLVGFFGK